MDKNTILAFLLIILVLIGSQFLYKPAVPAVPATKIETVKPSESQTAVQSPSELTKTPEIGIAQPAVIAAAQPDSNLYQPASSKDITIETDNYKAVFNSAGATLKSWTLKKYRQRTDSSQIIDLIRANTRNLSSDFFLAAGGKVEEFSYEVDQDLIQLSSQTPSGSVVFTCKNRQGATQFTKTLTFYNDKYSFDYTIDCTPVFPQLANDGFRINWLDGLKYTELTKDSTNLNREDYYTQAYYKKLSDKVVEFERTDKPSEAVSNIDWGATRTKYFEVFISTISDKQPANLKSFDKFIFYPSAIKEQPTHSDLGFSLYSYKKNPVSRFQVFIGPMDNELFSSYDKGFEQTLNWGWDIVKPFSFAVLWAMKFLHKFISNYGLVVVLLSIIVSLVTAPLNAKSIKSSLAMKKIQPQLQQIKQKFKGDMQRQQVETMQLYKQYGVNPFGACLPALLPMPILYGMFIIFGATIEFRDTGFMLWITDLSLPEAMFTLPFNIPFYGNNVGLLPILMSVMTFFQMKDSLTDPNQKLTVYIMPVFLLFLFNTLASGLNLYYFVSNVLRFVQQKMLNKKYANN